MDTYVNLVIVTYFFQASIEVFHVLNQKTSAESKVSFFFFTVIDHMDHYAILEICPFKKLKARLAWHRRSNLIQSTT